MTSLAFYNFGFTKLMLLKKTHALLLCIPPLNLITCEIKLGFGCTIT